jgi:hypothetical protein
MLWEETTPMEERARSRFNTRGCAGHSGSAHPGMDPPGGLSGASPPARLEVCLSSGADS